MERIQEQKEQIPWPYMRIQWAIYNHLFHGYDHYYQQIEQN